MKMESSILNLNDPIEMTILACLVLTLAYFFLKSGGHESVRKPESGEKKEGHPKPPAPPAPLPPPLPEAVPPAPAAPPPSVTVSQVRPVPPPAPPPQPAEPPRFVTPEMPAGAGNAMRAYLAVLDRMSNEPARPRSQSVSDLWSA